MKWSIWTWERMYVASCYFGSESCSCCPSRCPHGKIRLNVALHECLDNVAALRKIHTTKHYESSGKVKLSVITFMLGFNFVTRCLTRLILHELTWVMFYLKRAKSYVMH
ncbi:hypothetical protein R6Q57_016058 [Mikania cordata]